MILICFFTSTSDMNNSVSFIFILNFCGFIMFMLKNIFHDIIICIHVTILFTVVVLYMVTNSLFSRIKSLIK